MKMGLPGRLRVRQWPLEPLIGVQIPARQPMHDRDEFGGGEILHDLLESQSKTLKIKL